MNSVGSISEPHLGQVAAGSSSETGLAEIWGDVVSRRELAIAIVIGAAVSLATYWAAGLLFQSIVADKSLARALAMLAGLLGCVAGGTICAFRFKPKRQVLDEVGDGAWRTAALDELVIETGSIGKVEDLPDAVAAEMRDVGLYDAFAAYERRQLQPTMPSRDGGN
ncbi:MAG: hypothetical protein QM684_11540 [Rhizobium sp.]